MALEELEGSRGCFICDRSGTNPRSLGVILYWDGDSERTVIPFTPDDTWCGYEGIVHGGILSALCDDAMAWAAKKAIENWTVTADMSIRFLRPVKSGARYTAFGNSLSVDGRKVKTEARIIGEDGKTYVDAKGTFVGVRL
ncbi:MAG: PaaI family thioesterase [Thermovirgaceae bacterium]|nr:PaaI family thioesterase [Synergistales bacterium]HRU91301.1 PaaI family thioesterase [Thermovirgaceae bacterium]